MTHSYASVITITPGDERALIAIEQLTANNSYGLVRANELGAELWSDGTLRNGYRGSNCSAPFARPAGKVLKRLTERGLVEHHTVRGARERAVAWGWRLTAEGKRWRERVVLRIPHE